MDLTRGEGGEGTGNTTRRLGRPRKSVCTEKKIRNWNVPDRGTEKTREGKNRVQALEERKGKTKGAKLKRHKSDPTILGPKKTLKVRKTRGDEPDKTRQVPR